MPRKCVSIITDDNDYSVCCQKPLYFIGDIRVKIYILFISALENNRYNNYNFVRFYVFIILLGLLKSNEKKLNFFKHYLLIYYQNNNIILNAEN